MSQSKIKSYKFANSWDPKNGDPVRHIFNVMFENGEGGKHYALNKDSDKEFTPGTECTFNIVNSQVKDLVIFNPSPTANNHPVVNSSGHHAIAGFSINHATNLVVGEITAKVKIADAKLQDPIDRIKHYAEQLYSFQIELGTRPF